MGSCICRRFLASQQLSAVFHHITAATTCRHNNVKDDKDIFKIIAWHKLTPENQDTPLIVNNITISDHLEKAGALRGEVLSRYTAENDLGHYPN